MFRLSLFALLVLAACARQLPPRPETVVVHKDRISVRMSSGSRCTGPRNADTRNAEGWAGRLRGCDADYAYVVKLDEGTTPVRLLLEEVPGALGGADLLEPGAVVEIRAAPDRAYLFRAPD